MIDYSEFLESHVILKHEIVTFKTLSHALRVNMQTAKQMLFEFHQKQNTLKPKSISATYLLFGTPKSSTTDDDDEMVDDPTPAAIPLSDPIASRTMQLVHQDDLESVLDKYESVTSLHVYSLGGGSALELIADAPQFKSPVPDSDPVKDLEVYGSISNADLRRRANRTKRVILHQPASVKAPASIKAVPNAKIAEPGRPTSKLDFSKASSKIKVKKEEKSEEADKAKQELPKLTGDSQNLSKASNSTQSSMANAKKTASKTNSIMNSFAKAASRPKPKAAIKDEPEDTIIMSDDGDDDEPVPAPQVSAKAKATQAERAAKQEKLRRMMEEESENESDKQSEPEQEPEDTSMEDSAPEPQKPKTQEVVSSSGNGRKRGRRQVMKKKQTMDANGYFVTIQEKVWESFSESEDEPPATKPKICSTPANSGETTKAKKPAPKGQGNIMSFFQKK